MVPEEPQPLSGPPLAVDDDAYAQANIRAGPGWVDSAAIRLVSADVDSTADVLIPANAGGAK